MSPTRYKRILLKLSGEALASPNGFGVDPQYAMGVVSTISKLSQTGVQIAIVVGGGNYLRGGKSNFKNTINRATADQMGMLATMMNALALRDMLMASGVKAEVLSAKAVEGVFPAAGAHISKKLLQDGNVVIFAGGTGNPFVTTDSAASLRAVEIDADAILKATTVDGVFDADPKINPEAKKYHHVSFDEVVQKELAVMDLSAFTQCRDYNIPICVFNMEQSENLLKVMSGQNIGTWVSSGDEK